MVMVFTIKGNSNTNIGLCFDVSSVLLLEKLQLFKIQFRWWVMYKTVGNQSGSVFIVCKGISTLLSLRKAVMVTWTTGFAVAMPPLAGWGQYTPELNGIR